MFQVTCSIVTTCPHMMCPIPAHYNTYRLILLKTQFNITNVIVSAIQLTELPFNSDNCRNSWITTLEAAVGSEGCWSAADSTNRMKRYVIRCGSYSFGRSDILACLELKFLQISKFDANCQILISGRTSTRYTFEKVQTWQIWLYKNNNYNIHRDKCSLQPQWAAQTTKRHKFVGNIGRYWAT